MATRPKNNGIDPVGTGGSVMRADLRKAGGIDPAASFRIMIPNLLTSGRHNSGLMAMKAIREIDDRNRKKRETPLLS
jgi:hypothetical protein